MSGARNPDMQEIASIKDERIVQARELSTAAGRRKWNACLLEGEDILTWALDAGLNVRHVFCESGQSLPAELASLLKVKGVQTFGVSQGVLKKISDTHYVIPIIGVAGLPDQPQVPYGDLVLVLDGVRDHGNLGTIFRTAKAFGLRTVLSTIPDQDIYYRKVIEAARGTVFAAQFQRFQHAGAAIEALRECGYQIIVTSPRGRTLQSAVRLDARPAALVIGNETSGVSEAVMAAADQILQIPMSSGVESLNVGVAAGISLYEIKLKVVLQMLINKIRQTLGREVNVAGKLIQRAFDARLRTVCPYTSTQVITMMVLKCDDGDDAERIARDTGIWGQELDALLTPLLENGEIMLGQDGIYRLTEKGEALLAQLWGVLESSEAEIFRGFSAEDQRRFMNDLQRIQQNCCAVLEQNAGTA